MLTNHRRAIGWSVVLLGAMVFVFAAVGRHPPGLAPKTNLPFVGEFDLSVYHWMDDIRNGVLTLHRALPQRPGRRDGHDPAPDRRGGLAGVPETLARVRDVGAHMGAAELLLTAAKTFFHRGRPPLPLVDVVRFSFPSGHAVAGAATAVALVLVLLPAGPARRRWEFVAIGFAFVMALSRVYLSAHWFSDVVAGVLLGAGVALGSAGLVTEVRDIALRRKARAASASPT